jgi:hypothetical protein
MRRTIFVLEEMEEYFLIGLIEQLLRLRQSCMSVVFALRECVLILW